MNFEWIDGLSGDDFNTLVTELAATARFVSLEQCKDELKATLHEWEESYNAPLPPDDLSVK